MKKRKKVAKRVPRKPAKKKVVRKKPAKKNVSKKKAVKKAVINLTKSDREATRALKTTINKYLRAVTTPRNYNDLKRLANSGIDKLLKLGMELDRAQRRYLKMAQKYVNKLTGY